MAKKTDTAVPALKKTLNLKPLDDRVVVEPLDAEEKTSGGILLPQTAQQKPQQGKVIAVGPGKLGETGTRHTLAVAVGDVVLFGKYAGSDVEVSGTEYKILRESELLGKLV
jgi:chaperonin GroES